MRSRRPFPTYLVKSSHGATGKLQNEVMDLIGVVPHDVPTQGEQGALPYLSIGA